MTDLPKYTLSHDEKKNDWALKKDGSDRATKRFETKEEATKGGALAEALGSTGGSVKIQKVDGKYQEERTFPRSKDPRSGPSFMPALISSANGSEKQACRQHLKVASVKIYYEHGKLRSRRH